MTPLRIAIAGLGNVGAGTLRLLEQNKATIASHGGRPIEIVAVSARDPKRVRDCDVSLLKWVADPCELAVLPDVEAVVELIGGSEGVAREVCELALEHGRHVVTANKALLASHGLELAKLAEMKGVRLMFEGAAAGGIPVIKTLREALAGNGMYAIQGILNGTCNYILTRMARDKLDFDAALLEAQALGYAEADPSADVDGFDTAHKTALLASLAFGIEPDLSHVVTEGIRQITPVDLEFAEALGYAIKLLGVARILEQGIEQRVGPCLVPLGSSLARVDDVLNAVLLQGDAVGNVTLVGRGAGSNPTASAVVSDLIDLAHGYAGLPFGVPVEQLHKGKAAPSEVRVCGWYIRLQVVDKPGVLADISAILRDEGISIESLMQNGRSKTDSVPVTLTSHPASEAAMRRAIGKIKGLSSVKQEPCVLRIEEA